MMQRLGPEELQGVAEAVLARHQRSLRPGESITVTHSLDGQTETLGFAVHGEPEVFWFEARLERTREGSTAVLLDFLDGVLREWLEGGREAFPPLEFSPYRFEGVSVGLRGGKSRPDLEEEADRILREAGE